MTLRRRVIPLAALLALAAAAAPAFAATISISPPAGAHVDQQDAPPQYFRTADTQPTLGIQADAGAQVQCSLDQLPDAWGPCGPALPGCAAALCASFTPPSPLLGVAGDSMHVLDVHLLDAGGHRLANAGQSFTVDTTPPTTTARVTSDDPLRPSFSYSVGDDEYGDPRLASDVADCSLAPLGAPAVWRGCGDTQGEVSYRVPRRHADWRFQVRGTDDFGRSTTATVDFDPVPCALRASRPRTLGRVIRSGIPLRLDCSYVSSVDVLLLPLAVNGHRFASAQHALGNRPVIGELTRRLRGAHAVLRTRLRLFRDAAAQTRAFRSVTFMVAVCPGGGCEALTPDMSWAQLTVRR